MSRIGGLAYNPVPGSTSYHAWCCVKTSTTLKRCYLAFNTRVNHYIVAP